MPVYRFQCAACGLNFSKRTAVGVGDVVCVCGEKAERDVPRQFEVGTSVSGANGLEAPVTGISAHDYDVDRVVGEDARAKWAHIAARQKDKIQVMRATGASGFDLSRQHDGTYHVMTPSEREASERSRGFHFKVMDHIKKIQGDSK